MIPVVAALLVLGAMAGGGVLVLGWVCPFLGRAERLGYGSVIGMVVATDLILVLADLSGRLTLLEVLVGAGVLLELGLAIAARRGLLHRPADLAASARRWLPRDRGTWLAVAIIGLFAVRWALFWPDAVELRPEGLYATHVNVWGDWPVHLGIVNSFVDANNFPPSHPRFADHSFGYHYLADLTSAALVPLGLSAAGALELHSFVLSVVAAIALFAFGRALTRSSTAGALAVALFLLGGGLGWINTIRGLTGDTAGLPSGIVLPWDYRWKTESNFQWVNMFWGFWMSQRAFLYGMPMAFAILRTALHARKTRDLRLWAVAGVIAGLLPLAHLATLLALAIMVPVLFFLLPSRGWILFGVVWVLVALPQLLTVGGGGAGALGAIRFELGWMASAQPSPDPWPIFWLKNLGAFLVLGLLPIAVARIVPGVTRRLLVAFWAIWALANVVAFGPWDWDNHKVLVYWFVAVAVGSAATLVWLWRRWHSVLPRAALALVVVTMVASGVLEDVTQALGKSTYRMLSAEEVELGNLVAVKTPAKAVFLTGMDNHDPVQMVAGRTLWVGYANWLWTEGIPYVPREQQALTILRWGPDAANLLAASPVDYVVIGPQERSKLHANEDAFRQRFPVAFETANYRVYDIRSGRDPG